MIFLLKLLLIEEIAKCIYYETNIAGDTRFFLDLPEKYIHSPDFIKTGQNIFPIALFINRHPFKQTDRGHH